MYSHEERMRAVQLYIDFDHPAWTPSANGP